MGQIKVYPETLDYINTDVVMLFPEDEEFFRADIIAKGLTHPQKYFAVTEDNIRKHGYTLSKYISYKLDYKVGPLLRDGFGDQIHFFERWESLVFAFNNRSLDGFLRRPKPLRQVQNPFFPQYEAVVGLLSSFSTRVILPMLDCSPFFGRARNEIKPLWFKEAVNWRKSLGLFIADWERFSAANLLKVDSELNKLEVYAQRQQAAWSSFEKLNVANMFYQLSSFLFGLAKLHLEVGSTVVSLLCLHRSVDMYLQYCGLQCGVIKRSHRGIEYASSPDRISITTSLKLLIANGRLTSDAKRDKALDELNSDRNMLVLAHSVYGTKAETVQAFLKIVQDWITNAEGNLQWEKTRQYWFPLPTLDPKVLFDVETSIDSYIKEIPLSPASSSKS